MITRIPADALALPNGNCAQADCPRLIYRPQEDRWEVEGGSDSDNAKLNALRDNSYLDKCKNGVKIEVEDWQDRYREYVDNRLIGDMPRNCFFTGHRDTEINAISAQISDVLMKYYQGEAALDEVSEAFDNVVFKMKDLLYERCLTNGNNPADNQKIIQDTLFEFRRDAVALSVKACYEEGVSKYGRSIMSNGGVYYDSKYDELSKNVLSGIEDWAKGLSEIIPCDSINVNEWRDGPTTCKELYTSFNKRWDLTFGLNQNASEMSDCTMEPPENFSFFFQRNGDDATVSLNWEGGSKKLKVPFDIAKGQDRYRLSDLFQFSPPKSPYETQINQFLKNFTIYTAYGYKKAHSHIAFDTSI